MGELETAKEATKLIERYMVTPGGQLKVAEMVDWHRSAATDRSRAWWLVVGLAEYVFKHEYDQRLPETDQQIIGTVESMGDNANNKVDSTWRYGVDQVHHSVGAISHSADFMRVYTKRFGGHWGGPYQTPQNAMNEWPKGLYPHRGEIEAAYAGREGWYWFPQALLGAMNTVAHRIGFYPQVSLDGIKAREILTVQSLVNRLT